MIRARLLIGFILVALLPTIGVGIGTYIVSYQSGRQQSIERLESVAARKELAIQVWFQSLQQELKVASQTDYSPKLIDNALVLANENQSYTWYNNLVRKRLQYFVDRSDQIDEIFLINLDGKVVVSTNLERENTDYRGFILNDHELNTPFTQLPFNQNPTNETQTDSANQSFVFVSIPINKSDGEFLGAIGGMVNVSGLLQILNEKTGLGTTGQSYLIDQNNAFLVGSVLSTGQNESSREIEQGLSTGVDFSIQDRSNKEGIYTNPAGVKVVGVYRWIPEYQYFLAVEQDFAEAFNAVSKTTIIILFILFLSLTFAVLSALYVTRNIANPIIDLAKTASHIAQGDLELISDIERSDEVGILARAFNSMTIQLRDLINSLENRVRIRTGELENANEVLKQRALQLETSAQVGRQITSILDLDVLLNQIVELIQDAFGYYHVQVFLLENDTNQLVMGASSGNHFIQHDRLDFQHSSINREAIITGNIQLVNDVLTNFNYLPDEVLPDTRSELVAPLKVGEKIIGTLDVHDTRVNAFTEEDALVIQSLGDQIAVAIENAHLYNQSKELAILEERSRLSRELHDSVTQSLYCLVLLTESWRRMLKGNGKENFEEYLGKIGEISQQALKEMRLLIIELRPPILEQEGLVGAIQKRLDSVEKRFGIEARVVMEDFIELPPPIIDEFYWIAQEALNNSLKHAEASKVIVRLYFERDTIVLEVMDNGKGFDPATIVQSGGLGLINMDERARQIGGSLEVRSIPGDGTTIKVKVPLPKDYKEVSG